MGISTDSSQQALRNLVPGLVACGVLIIGTAAIDLAGSVWPFLPGSFEWRYGAIGIASNYTVTPTIGIGMIILAAILGDRPILLRMVALVAIVVSVVLFATILVFLLDGLQVHQVAAVERHGAVTRAILVATSKLTATGIVLFLLSRRSWRGPATDRLAREIRAPIVGVSV